MIGDEDQLKHLCYLLELYDLARGEPKKYYTPVRKDFTWLPDFLVSQNKSVSEGEILAQARNSELAQANRIENRHHVS